jgi:hypothetical protein
MVSILYKWLLISGILFYTQVTGHTELEANHPIFVSVTEIELNTPQKMLEISCKLYTDDFEKTLRMHTKERVDLLNAQVKKQMDVLVNNYIQQHLLLQADGKKVVLQYLGFEQQEEGIVSFFQAANINSLKKLDITNNLLYEYKTEQLGIIHVTVNGNRKSTKLNNPDALASFSF